MVELHKYYVVTPEYSEIIPVLDDGSGPMEYCCDVIEIEAENTRDAIALGVKLMLESSEKEFPWVHSCRSDGYCPWAGIKAKLVEQADTEDRLPPDWDSR
jgi:hypothetical protein